MRRAPAFLILFAAGAAHAQATQPVDPLEQELAGAVAADKAAPPPAPAVAPTTSPALLNPEISLIGTFSAAWRRNDTPPPFEAGDDPDPSGIGMQELEISFASTVDPYFNMRAFLTMPDADAIEIEEAYLETTSLPVGLLLKAGIFRSSFGRNNEQHLHVQDFPRRPRTTALLGEDGLRGPGAQLSYLLPTSWYASLFAEVFDLGGELSATGGLEQFFDLSSRWSLMVGASAGSLLRDPEGTDGEPPPPLPREFVVGGDVYLKWKPENVTQTYAWVALQLEYIASRPEDGDFTGVGYAALVAQVARRIRVGARLELIGLPGEGDSHLAATGSLAFLPTEFSRVRLAYSRDETKNDTVFLQLEATIGAHGAHPF